MPSTTTFKKLKWRILIVDDMSDGRDMLSRILRHFGFEVETAEDGQQAYNKAMSVLQASPPFDAVLMDMQMPVMDGFAATAMLRSNKYPGRIIALTGTWDARQKCIEAGCDDFAAKPIELDSLLKIIERNLQPTLRDTLPVQLAAAWQEVKIIAKK